MLERLFPQQADDKLFVENVFSTTLYSGTGGFRGINVGISNFAVAGGMVWMKARNSGVFGNEIHRLYDTARANSSGGGSLVCSPSLQSNSASQDASGSSVTFYSTGTAITVAGGNPNNSDYNYAAWSFRKAPKFFDVVTWTGDGTDKTINHSLGVAPGIICIKKTNATGNWWTYHRSLGLGPTYPNFLYLNTTSSVNSGGGGFFSGVPTSSQFFVGPDINTSGDTFVAYLFAHDPSADGIIQCGSYTGNGSTNGPEINLGWEPQWILQKNASANTSWVMVDAMRGLAVSGLDAALLSDSSTQEFTQDYYDPLATGFKVRSNQTSGNGNGNTHIYVAIRRGPMRTPTLGTSVFSANIFTTNDQKQTTGFPVDMLMGGVRAGGGQWASTLSRLQGLNTTTTSAAGYPRLITSSNSAELSGTNVYYGYDNTGFLSGGLTGSTPNVAWSFRRAPGFMDVVCYTGTGSTRTVAHNLGVAPELMIVKRRNDNADWVVYAAPLGATKNLYLPSSDGVFTNPFWNDTNPTSSVFTIGGGFPATNASGSTYVAYLFASVPGVSKVGSYTGNGSSQTINCAFTTGARFVLIKRTDSAGDWYVWDSARGIVAGNDPYLALNSTAAEVTSNDSVDTDNTGFVVNQVAASNINVNAATYIYLAIA